MSKTIYIQCLGIACFLFFLQACSLPTIIEKKANPAIPERYAQSSDTTNAGQARWQDFFTDPYLTALIDTALQHNQELNIARQEIAILRNEVSARKGEYLPFVDIGGAAGVEKVGRYTSQGASDASTEIEPGKEVPDPLPDYLLAATASWEVDVWKKLRNARQSAVSRYLASVEGQRFMRTNLVAEIANSYYELMALDNQLEIVKRNIQIQTNALQIVRLQKRAARATELAVRKFEAEVLKNQSRQYYIQQEIIETENRINFLLGRYPGPIPRNSPDFNDLKPGPIQAGVPSQLLANRPDIRQAEREITASKLDVQVAKANFYPSIRITAGLGFRAFNPKYLVSTPQSLLFSLAGDLIAPVINRNAIKATYLNANAKQIQAVYDYEQTILAAYLEVSNQLSSLDNLAKSYELTSSQVQALTESITISTNLFKSAKADYMEVLLTQRDALDARFELIENKKQQMHTLVELYRALGGGWQ
jgi:NodT family efflux transporter outer membrane factor (OMF) lipoprotein